MSIRCETDIQPDMMIFTTRSNGDRIEIRCALGATNSANLATLINSGETLTLIVKKKVE
jgi:hypothetical protein